MDPAAHLSAGSQIPTLPKMKHRIEASVEVISFIIQCEKNAKRNTKIGHFSK